MPSLTVAYTNGKPLIQADLKVSRAYATGLVAAGRPVPKPINGPFYVDTGAEDTFVDLSLIGHLSLRLKDQVPIRSGLSGRNVQTCDRFDAGLEIIGPAGTGFAYDNLALPVIGADFRGRGYLGLIGLDVLCRLNVSLDGPSQQLTLYY